MSEGNAHVAITQCEFLHNAALGLVGEPLALGGGAALLAGNHDVLFSECAFFNNSGHRGGGLGIYDSNTFVHVLKTHFRLNSAVVNGGAMYMVFDNSDLLIQDCTFHNNSAEYGAQ